MAVLLMGAAMFTACDDNDNEQHEYIVPVTKGAFLLCSGNMSGNIDGSVSYLDYTSNQVANKQFQAQNGRSLGGTPNDALVYGSKMYIAVTGENTLEVVDAKTLKSLRQIKTNVTFGEGCLKPRHLTASGDKVYISFYGKSESSYDENWNATTKGNGYVVAIDTTTFTRQGIYEAGSFPEGISVADKKLYVCNSDYAACTKPSISIIDLTTGSGSLIKNDNIVNPQKIVLTAAGDMYVLDFGNYGDKKSGVYKISAKNNEVTRLMDANDMDCIGSNIFGYYTEFDDSYKPVKTTYQVYNLLSQGTSTFYTDTNNEIIPACIGVDPVVGTVFIASNVKNADTGKTDYKANSKIFMFNVEYSQQGVFVSASKNAKVWGATAGVGPCAFAFNVTTNVIKY